LSHKLSEGRLDDLLRGLREAKDSLETSLTPQLPLELTLTHILTPKDTASAPSPSSPSVDPASNVSSASHTTHSERTASDKESFAPDSSSPSSTSEHSPSQDHPSSEPESPTPETEAPESSFAEATSAPSSESDGSANILTLMPHLQKAIEAEQTSLAPFFEQCTLHAHQDSVITFQAASSFQKRKLEQNREVIEHLLERLGAGRLRVQFTAEEAQSPSRAASQTDEASSTSFPQTSEQPPKRHSTATLGSSGGDIPLESADEVEQVAEDIFQKSL